MAIAQASGREEGVPHLRWHIDVKFHHLGCRKNKLWLDLKHRGEEE